MSKSKLEQILDHCKDQVETEEALFSPYRRDEGPFSDFYTQDMALDDSESILQKCSEGELKRYIKMLQLAEELVERELVYREFDKEAEEEERRYEERRYIKMLQDDDGIPF